MLLMPLDETDVALLVCLGRARGADTQLIHEILIATEPCFNRGFILNHGVLIFFRIG